MYTPTAEMERLRDGSATLTQRSHNGHATVAQRSCNGHTTVWTTQYRRWLNTMVWGKKFDAYCTKHNSIERRHITAVNTRTQDLGNELERLALHAQSSLPQCSREFRNVITPPRKISYVITRQDGCHKLMFLRKGDQYFVTLNDRPWQ